MSMRGRRGYLKSSVVSLVWLFLAQSLSTDASEASGDGKSLMMTHVGGNGNGIALESRSDGSSLPGMVIPGIWHTHEPFPPIGHPRLRRGCPIGGNHG